MRRSGGLRWLALAGVLIVLAGCASENHSPAASENTPPTGTGDDDAAPPVTPAVAPVDPLSVLFGDMGFEEYLAIRPVRSGPAPNGYTRYYFDLNDARCFDGEEANVAVSYGTSNNVMLFMEGGGARWPGDGGLAVNLDTTADWSFKSREADNPLRDWNFVYVPYCDASIHSGNNALEYDGMYHWHWGLRQAAAAVALMKRLFPAPDKVLVAGSSAGGFGTFVGWAIAKSEYRDTKTYVLNDSGCGFWNPDDPETWDLIERTWAVRIPPECARCEGTTPLFLYELYQDLDPQVRIGMFSSYQDWIMTHLFFNMDPAKFQADLVALTGELRAAHPDRYARFLIKGNSHTTYPPLLPAGPHYTVDGVSVYDWIDGLVNDDPDWPDLLE